MFLRPFWVAYLSAYCMLSVSGTLVLIPPRLVVEHGAKASAVCSTNMTIESMAWEASEGSVDITSGVQQLTWTVPHIKEWDIKPLCFVNFKEEHLNTQRVALPVTVYKVPEKVSVTVVNHTGAMTEGKNYRLFCNIQNAAPVQKVIVNWYKERSLVKRDNETSKETTKEPRNKAAILQISAVRTDDGAQYRCESELELGADGPQPAPRVISEPLSTTVHYMPQFSNPIEIVVDKGGVITLDCTVKANPPAVYTWTSAHQDEHFNTSVITPPSQRSQNYTCTASNKHGSDSKVFIIKEKGKRIVFWIIIIVGIILALLLIVVYGLFRKTFSSNSVI